VSFGLLLCDDLLFASKVTATAAAHGLSVAVRKSPEALLAAAAANPPAGVIVDLNTPGLEVEALISRLSAIGPVRVIGFGSHVDKETLDAAKAAGCNEVMPRSKFVKELEANLLGWFS
jgi:DNA-binding NarL/FixJ family response regulator